MNKVDNAIAELDRALATLERASEAAYQIGWPGNGSALIAARQSVVNFRRDLLERGSDPAAPWTDQIDYLPERRQRRRDQVNNPLYADEMADR